MTPIPAVLVAIFAMSGSAYCRDIQPAATFNTVVKPQKSVMPTAIAATPGWRVVYFWSSVCPCVKACERYSFLPLAAKYHGQVTFFAVASDGYELAMPKNELSSAITSRHLPYSVLIDRDHELVRYFGARVTPETFLIDPAGNIVFDGMPDDSRRFIWDTPKEKHGAKMPVPSSYLGTALGQALAGGIVTETPLKEAGCSISW